MKAYWLKSIAKSTITFRQLKRYFLRKVFKLFPIIFRRLKTISKVPKITFRRLKSVAKFPPSLQSIMPDKILKVSHKVRLLIPKVRKTVENTGYKAFLLVLDFVLCLLNTIQLQNTLYRWTFSVFARKSNYTVNFVLCLLKSFISNHITGLLIWKVLRKSNLIEYMIY